MTAAVAEGHFRIVQWLYENYKVSNNPNEALVRAAGNGHINIPVWLHERRAAMPVKLVLRAVIETKQMLVIQGMEKHFDAPAMRIAFKVLLNEDVKKSAYDGSIDY